MAFTKRQLADRLLDREIRHDFKKADGTLDPEREGRWEIIQRIEMGPDGSGVCIDTGFYNLLIMERDIGLFLNGDTITVKTEDILHEITLGEMVTLNDGSYWSLTREWKERWWQTYIGYTQSTKGAMEAIRLTDKAIKAAYNWLEYAEEEEED